MDREKINLVPDKEKCSGCGACAAICAQNAITMQEDQTGCKYPSVDETLCLQCGRCMKVCSYREAPDVQMPLAAYAACGRDCEQVRHSASGGIFAALAQSWIQKGGAAAGAVMDIDRHVKVYHVLSDRPEDIRRMQGSKYAQSDAWRCYRDVTAALKAGKQVLFSGTPCQVAAVRALTGNPDNLTTIDLICHGVPPVRMLDEYLHLLEKRFGGKITDFSFRDKKAGRDYCARFVLRRGRTERALYLSSSMLSYYKHFLQGMNCRENCYTCPYAKLERNSDVTIGDYWGVEKQHQLDFQSGKMPNRKDWSCVLVNTEKGERLMEKHAGMIERYRSSAEAIAQENHQLCHPTKRPEQRDELLNLYCSGGYAALEKQFLHSVGGLRYYFRLLKQLRRTACEVNKELKK